MSAPKTVWLSKSLKIVWISGSLGEMSSDIPASLREDGDIEYRRVGDCTHHLIRIPEMGRTTARTACGLMVDHFVDREYCSCGDRIVIEGE